MADELEVAAVVVPVADVADCMLDCGTSVVDVSVPVGLMLSGADVVGFRGVVSAVVWFARGAGCEGVSVGAEVEASEVVIGC